jgi:2-keto-4-pentenoate hydratase/2-oxohepta-3-ene-1,7-dioic acid hydratase in catechol pathway
MASLIANFDTTLPKIEAFLGDRPKQIELSEVRLLSPLSVPSKILCSGINYKGHFDENPKAVMPKSPFFFTKLPNTVIGTGDAIIKSDLTNQLDYEVEFSVVVGKKMSRTAPEDVMGSIFGYTILNDVSARDVQFTDSQITLGKNFDTFAPIGPWIVTADEIPHPEAVSLRTLVNGEVLQDGSTSDWVYTLPDLLAALTAVITLEPGDIVTTGTPAGVGYFQNPQIFLQPGDEVRLEIEGIGSLVNTVVKG